MQVTNEELLEAIKELHEAIEHNTQLTQLLLEELQTNNHDTEDIKKVIVAGTTFSATAKQVGVNIIADLIAEAAFGKR